MNWSPRLGAVAVFRTGVRGARLVPRKFRRPQNLFDLHRCAKTTTIFRHWVGVGGLKAIFSLWPGIDKIRHWLEGPIHVVSVQKGPVLKGLEEKSGLRIEELIGSRNRGGQVRIKFETADTVKTKATGVTKGLSENNPKLSFKR
ncbi:hypothetical protein AVEN_202944-1 [Araneus ventricosus]|uniref:Uncharacterized protein n=1 Tax=Araneus ventricosus TaxID=182803 RepID=A0A4Y2BPC6_ARAVE|nr:hypothetical protein AVEN_202944-1 [Araneus ventricosus]